ncbi:MAG: ATP-binding cassette domain-containing protein [Oscillospiraceae bacterium]|nr:ATP-binding cassette domain-containing protein [Oscillospiraceae bacterium]
MIISNLNKTYDRRGPNANPVLRDVSFSLPETGFVCILGPSGCGKTSLLNAIGGLDRFDSGTMEFGGLTVSGYGVPAFEAERNRSFGYIFQNYYLLQDHSVAYNVYLGLHSLKLSHAEKLRRVREALAAVDMERYIRRRVSDLSGGQQQRVAIARALARRPRVIFADEPTGNLDEANTLNICTLLRKISKSSLVVMVTHEERIASFFADRIITLDSGRISSDSQDWQRGSLTVEGGNTLYAGDYREERPEGDSVELRVLREEGAEPVKLTVVALKDRIVIQLDDTRAVTCTASGEVPRIMEGMRPTMTLEAVERQEETLDFAQGEDIPARAGLGLNFSMMLAQARQLVKGKGLQRFGSWFFMAVLTVLTLLTVGDYLTVSAVDPHEFIRTDSHILELRAERGKTLDVTTLTLTDMIGKYIDYYETSGVDFTVVPHVAPVPEISAEIYMQLDQQTIQLSNYSYVPLDYLDESTLILGRMPENPKEVVVDRWVLDAVLREEGILQNSIHDISFFLDQRLSFPKKTYGATIVGISDCGEAAMFMELSALASIGVSGSGVVTLEELRQLYPGQFEDVTLGAGECLYLRGETMQKYSPGQTITVNKTLDYTVAQVAELECYAAVAVNESELEPIIRAMLTQRFYLYCGDKAAMKAFLAQPMPDGLAGMLQVAVVDAYASSWRSYEQASSLRADARTIVTVTIMALAAVMLYLLRRTQVHGRIELLAVYRLLGIPSGKLMGIFALESGMLFLTSAAPAALITWLAVTILTGIEDLGFSLILPWQAAAVTATGILLYHQLVSLLPLGRLLRLPPARLAAKYDF